MKSNSKKQPYNQLTPEGSGNVDRLTRVNNLLKQELAMLVERADVAPAPGMLISVTEVRTSVDLRNATVSISIFGSNSVSNVEKVLRTLNLYRPEWQRHIAKHLGFKHTPVLLFKQDDRARAADEVLRMIEDMEEPSDNE